MRLVLLDACWMLYVHPLTPCSCRSKHFERYYDDAEGGVPPPARGAPTVPPAALPAALSIQLSKCGGREGWRCWCWHCRCGDTCVCAHSACLWHACPSPHLSPPSPLIPALAASRFLSAAATAAARAARRAPRGRSRSCRATTAHSAPSAPRSAASPLACPACPPQQAAPAPRRTSPPLPPLPAPSPAAAPPATL